MRLCWKLLKFAWEDWKSDIDLDQKATKSDGIVIVIIQVFKSGMYEKKVIRICVKEIINYYFIINYNYK